MSRSSKIPKRDVACVIKNKATSELSIVTVFFQQGISLHQKGQIDEAFEIYKKIILTNPNYFDALHMIGVIFIQKKQYELAIDFLKRAIKTDPINSDAFYNLGLAYDGCNQNVNAYKSYLKSIKLNNKNYKAYNNKSKSESGFGKYAEALISAETAIAIKVDYIEAYINSGNALQELKLLDDALAIYNRAIALKPNCAEAFCNRGNTLQELKRLDEALASYDQAIAINPNYQSAYRNRGNALKELNLFDEAIVSYERAIAIKPDFDFLLGDFTHIKMLICNWDEYDNKKILIRELINAGKKVSIPFPILALDDTPITHRLCSEIFCKEKYPRNDLLGVIPKRTREKKIRVGYFSADFHNHATAYLMAEFFEAHNKEQFELIAFSFGPDKQDEMRLRLSKAFDQFIDVRNQSDQEIAKLSRELRVDIAIDLKGYTKDSRTGIFSFRAAPIQINYLGYPGTMGAEYIDYIVADRILIPNHFQQFYSEKIVYLPNSYQVNDRKRVISDRFFTRSELGLPEIGFVFSCFNNNYKITPTIFDSWMRILRSVKNSVLWLLEDNPSVSSNLKKEAERRGVDANRLVFAKRMPLAEHLARHRQADLFIDTFPYNAHTTSSDALWVGLPVLTLSGESFASRVAGSLLSAIHLPELITYSQSEYEALAIELATDPEKLSIIKQKLVNNRLTTPLFDASLFTAHMEDAYIQIMTRYWSDMSPENIVVEANINAAMIQQPQAASLIQKGLRLHQQGKLNEARVIYEQVLKIQPNHFDALQLLGAICTQKQEFKQAVDFLSKALEINPKDATCYCNLGVALEELKQFEKALTSYERAIFLKPEYAEAYINRGSALKELDRLEDALVSYEQAIALRPKYAEAYCYRGVILKQLRRLNEALDSYDEAIAINPEYADAYSNRGIVLQELLYFDEALASYDKAIAIKPNYAAAYSNRGSVLNELKRFDEALVSYDQTIVIQPDYAVAYGNRGVIFQEVKRFEEAIASYERALAVKPDYDFLLGHIQNIKMLICNWDEYDNKKILIRELINAGKKVSIPFPILALDDTPITHRLCSEIFCKEKYPRNDLLGVIPKRTREKKIRVGYFSADFHNHATAYLMAEFFEAHNKEQFELIAFSFGPDKQDEMRLRLSKAFDQFIDVRNQSDQEIAKLSRELRVDIAIDLKGYTKDSRTGIFSFRAAPIQINYLGYPGTMGAEYIDYIVADRILIPNHFQQFYSEKIVYLPNSYQVNDRKRVISDRFFTRSELGLPEIGFVFSCFNNNYKITPTIFDSWMRILRSVKNSVLWLLEDNPSVSSNLKKEAERRGVDANRLVFAKRMPLAEHLARHRQADLFIDTFPYNAHTTSSDALWVGLPVLTLSGESFASRVAGSLLSAIHLPELITYSQSEYEALAIELATDPEKLSIIKQKLVNNRLTTPLFDASLFTAHMEDAYIQIMTRYWSDMSPENIVVEANINAAMIQQPQAASLIQKGLRLHQQGKLNEARVIYEQVLKIQPNHFDVLELLSMISVETKEYSSALNFLSKALEINPKHAASYSNRGNVYKVLKHLDEALANYDQAIALNPQYVEAYCNRGVVLRELHRLEDALASYDQAVKVKSNYAQAHCSRGYILKELNRLEDSLTSYDQAIAIKTDYAEAYSCRGVILKKLGRLNEALASYDTAISIKPDYAEALSNRGVILQELNRLDEALASYDRAIAIKPEYAEAYWNKSLALLRLADFGNGLILFERRWENENIKKRIFKQPLWLGRESIKDKTVLLYAEQGLGDTIQFCRYVSLVAQLGAVVILEVQLPLVKLLENLDGVSHIMSNGEVMRDFDYQCPLLSLPLAFKTELLSIPSSKKYITSDDIKTAKWKSKLGVKTKLRVGMAWSSVSGFEDDSKRSLPLSAFLSALPREGFEYICLQKEIKEIDKKTLIENPEIKFLGDMLDDFSDTASLCELMDIVISVDTSIAHLSGSLGRPTWLLLPFVADWRWLLDRTDSPWYSSMKLYRQQKIGDWTSVFEKIKSDLKEYT